MPGLKTIISLSFILAIGFLLVILSAALYKNYLPLIVVANYLLTPLPNALCSSSSSSSDIFSGGDDGGGRGLADFGRFVTGFLVVFGIALPAVLAHSGIIAVPAGVMAVVGGLLIYGTIVTFGMCFTGEEENLGF